MAAAQTERGVPLSALCPKFLHTNSTSHTWPFSAIAELIDNAYDPDVNAKQFWIDKTQISGQECLSFMDNGNGLNYDMMLRMLSFGYSDKTAVNGQEPIGIYGNGFKSGSMRLGRDVIVFSKSKDASCVGMLSQTYLETIKAEQIIVPIVSFEQIAPNKFCVSEEHKASLQDILRYSPLTDQMDLLNELKAINSTRTTPGATGTRIIIWNLRRTSSGKTEFDFTKDRYDIQIPSDVYETMSEEYKRPERFTSSSPESDYSLRAYCSILYLKPRMQIIIRGQKVQTQLISKSLAYREKDGYKPNFLDKRVSITFGYNTKSKDHYGIMMYHKNRLIKSYERVGCQTKANIKGVGVIGVIECNFLDPTHNKQAFDNTDKYRRMINSLGVKLEEYWNEIRYKKSGKNPRAAPLEETTKRPDQNWVQCDQCLRWRKLPDGINVDLLPKQWFCRMNPDPQFRSCQVEEEPEDSDDDQPTYRKTYKQQEREDKRKLELKRRTMEEEQKRRDVERLATLAQQNEKLRRQREDLERQLSQTTVGAQYPSTPDTPRSRPNNGRLLGGAARAASSPLNSSTLSQAAFSPSTSRGLPVISNVCSLSTTPSTAKRASTVTPDSEPKRSRLNGVCRRSLNPSTANPSSSTSAVVIPLDDDDDDDITDDDDIVILETASTPVPKRPGFDLAKVKTEQQSSSSSAVGMVMECSDDAAVETTPNTNAAETGSTETAAVGTGPSLPSEQVSTTTQTELTRVKNEEEEEEKRRRKKKEDNKKPGQGEETAQRTSVAEEQENTRSGEKTTRPDNGKDGSAQGDRENPAEKALDSGSAASHPSEPGSEPGPSRPDPVDLDARHMQDVHARAISEAQVQQDQLLELMQAAAQERDSFKEQVHRLTCQLQDAQARIEELSRNAVKKECCHQDTQTEESGQVLDYKSLYEKAQCEAEELRREKEALLETAGQGEKRVKDEMTLQVNSLAQSLDECKSEKEVLRLKVESLEKIKVDLSSQCESLKSSLKELRVGAARSFSSTTQTADTCVAVKEEREAGDSDASAAGSDDQSRLRELRHNVGRMLVRAFVPALDLDQVNYECNVIDEILEQVLDDVQSTGGVATS